MARTASISRKTKETDISCEINIDGIGGAQWLAEGGC